MTYSWWNCREKRIIFMFVFLPKIFKALQSALSINLTKIFIKIALSFSGAGARGHPERTQQPTDYDPQRKVSLFFFRNIFRIHSNMQKNNSSIFCHYLNFPLRSHSDAISVDLAAFPFNFPKILHQSYPSSFSLENPWKKLLFFLRRIAWCKSRSVTNFPRLDNDFLETIYFLFSSYKNPSPSCKSWRFMTRLPT